LNVGVVHQIQFPKFKRVLLFVIVLWYDCHHFAFILGAIPQLFIPNLRFCQFLLNFFWFLFFVFGSIEFLFHFSNNFDPIFIVLGGAFNG